MSWARFTPDSDVYIYEHVDGHFECQWCMLATAAEGKRASFTCKTVDEMHTHMREHEEAGHKVPPYAYEWGAVA